MSKHLGKLDFWGARLKKNILFKYPVRMLKYLISEQENFSLPTKHTFFLCAKLRNSANHPPLFYSSNFYETSKN